MNKTEVLDYLETHKDPRGITHWERLAGGSGLRSVGIGLTKLRKFAKSVGTDAKLARQLWNTDLYEAKVVSLLIDDPKTMTVEQAEQQVDELAGGQLAHVFSSCDATLAKTPFAVEIMDTWIASKDPVRRRCGYGLLYEVAKWNRKSAPDDRVFLDHIARIEKTCYGQPMPVLLAMGGALMSIGKRNRKLNAAALKLADKIGPIDFDPDGRCDPMDVAAHLRSEQLQRRLKP